MKKQLNLSIIPAQRQGFMNAAAQYMLRQYDFIRAAPHSSRAAAALDSWLYFARAVMYRRRRYLRSVIITRGGRRLCECQRLERGRYGNAIVMD